MYYGFILLSWSVLAVVLTPPLPPRSLLYYSSDRQLSLDLVNVGRQRLDFLPMLEHSGTYRESPMHTGTFAQEIITLVHHVKGQHSVYSRHASSSGAARSLSYGFLCCYLQPEHEGYLWLNEWMMMVHGAKRKEGLTRRDLLDNENWSYYKWYYKCFSALCLRHRAVFQGRWHHPEWAFLSFSAGQLLWGRGGGDDAGWEVQFKPVRLSAAINFCKKLLTVEQIFIEILSFSSSEASA